MKAVFFALAFALVVVPVSAQSLADAAKQAQEARATGDGWPAPTRPAEDAPKAYTNADLGPNTGAPAVSTATVVASMSTSIRAQCALAWPDDFRMRAFCETQHRNALEKIHARGDLMKSTPAHVAIRLKCLKDWAKLGAMVNGERQLIVDFKMNNFCEEEQLKALGALR